MAPGMAMDSFDGRPGLPLCWADTSPLRGGTVAKPDSASIFKCFPPQSVMGYTCTVP